jgi:hypothetical protein
MAATRFLPGVLSFLCALSHLEGVAHRPNNLFFQLQPPLSLGESVVQTGQQDTPEQTIHVHHNPRESRHEHPRAAPDRCNSITRLSRDETLLFSSIWQHGIDSHSGFSGMRDESSMQGSIQTPRFRTEKGRTSFPEQTQTLSQNQHGLLIQGMYTQVFSEPDTGFLNHRDARRFFTGFRLVVLSPSSVRGQTIG